MKGMASQQEGGDFIWATPGSGYPLRIHEATAQISKSGSTMITLQLRIEGGPFDGVLTFDRIITEGGKPGAGFGKTKLRGLGIDLSSDAEVSDEQIAAGLKGLLVYGDLDVEQRFNKNPATNEYDVPVTTIRDGKQLVVMQNKVTNYYRHPVNAQPGLAAQPAAFPAAAPAAFPQALPQQPQFAPPAQLAPVAAQPPVVPQGFPQGAPQGFPQGAWGAPPAGAPQWGAPPPNGGFAGAPAPWAQPAAPVAAQVQPEAGGATSGKRGKKG